MIMKTFIIILTVLTGLGFFTTLVCGLWIKANNIVEQSSLQFHLVSGIISVILAVILIVMLLRVAIKTL